MVIVLFRRADARLLGGPIKSGHDRKVRSLDRDDNRTEKGTCPLNQPALAHGGFDEGGKERVRIERLRFQLGMELHADEPGM